MTMTESPSNLTWQINEAYDSPYHCFTNTTSRPHTPKIEHQDKRQMWYEVDEGDGNEEVASVRKLANEIVLDIDMLGPMLHVEQLSVLMRARPITPASSS